MKVPLGVGYDARRFCACALFLVLGSLTAQAAVIFPKVTNVNDSGSGSLRAAITAANANASGGAIVQFQLGADCGPHVIHLATPLPDLTKEIHIEGFSQTGSSKNDVNSINEDNAVLCVVLAGDNAVDDAFTVPTTVSDAMEISVQGIAFSGFTHSAVNLRGGSNHVVAGIRTGGILATFALQPNAYGVIIAPGVSKVTVGGTDQGDTNQLADITHNAIYIESSTANSVAANNNLISRNLIGFIDDGTNAFVLLPTGGAAMAVGGYKNMVVNNYLNYSGASGLHISNTDAHDNTVMDNVMSTNQGDGLLIDDDAHDNIIADNSLFDNVGAGVRIVNGQGNKLLANNIEGNDGLGIDLANAGVTPNDNDAMQPAVDYANRGLNFPVLAAAAGGHTGTITGTFTSVPGTYYINLSGTETCDPSGHGQGGNIFEYATANDGYKITVPNLTVDGQGSVAFNIPVVVAAHFATATYVAATAIDSAGNTSEFSQCLIYSDDTVFYDGFE